MLTAQFYATRLSDAPARYSRQPIGPWMIGVTLLAGIGDTRDPRVPGAPAVAVVDYCAGCWGEIRRLWVAAGPTPPAGDGRGPPVEGQPGFAFAPVMLPPALDETQRLWLIAEGWDGRLHQASWPVGRPD